ncbi:MAG: DUF58 domain-containing protein [Lentisphaerae bacterium]|nr:DUF58 domain-containing protein [Lentisphaerota bacterium]
MNHATENDALKYVDPQTLAKVKNLELISRFAVQGFFQGLHRSPFFGLSVEYSDHRPYSPGDELKFVDWKAYARTNELVIKRFHQETNVQCNILLDSSASMGYGSGDVRKIDYACFLAGALTYLMLMQNDGVGLAIFNDRLRTRIPPSSRGTQFHPILSALNDVRPEATTELPSVLHDLADSITRRGLVIVISDLLADPEEISNGLVHLRHLKHDVLVFQLLDDSELNLHFADMTEFCDPESAHRLRAFPDSIREEYIRRINEFTENYRRTCGQNQIDYCLLNTRTTLAQALAAYLARRKTMM